MASGREITMTEFLSKLFARGNRLSDRLYADRARPDRVVRELERERRVEAAAGPGSRSAKEEKKK
jgi:hypothetical protein